jgi:hypothetical protein
MAPLWESGSIELPDPQVFDVPWVESYIHNICTFPKAAHDDDMDATSQALLYMRGCMVDGILEFYRLEGKAAKKPEKPSLDEVFPDSPATRVVLEALTDGHQIQCSARQYEEIRQTLLRVAEMWKGDPRQVGRYMFVASEIQRLDRLLVEG